MLLYKIINYKKNFIIKIINYKLLKKFLSKFYNFLFVYHIIIMYNIKTY